MRKNAPDNLMDHKSSKHSENLVTIMSYLPEGGLKKDLPLKFDQSLDTQIATEGYGGNKPATIITRNFGTPSSARCIHPKIDRALTTREGARLQSF